LFNELMTQDTSVVRQKSSNLNASSWQDAQTNKSAAIDLRREEKHSQVGHLASIFDKV